MRLARPRRRTGTAPGPADPGSAARSAPAAGRCTVDVVLLAALAAELEPQLSAMRPPRARLRSVVSPYDLFSRAYSSLPTRIRVVSSSRTTVASTFSRGSPGRARSSSHARADRRQRRPERHHPLVLGLVADLRASAGGSGTASAPSRRGRSPGCGPAGRADPDVVQAGGITSERIRSSVARSVTFCPSGPT